MDQAPPDYSAARNNMVDGQVRPNKVTDPRILDAMRSLPRERFVPPGLAALAYADEDIPLGRGRALMEPMVIARLVQLARGRAGEKALVIGAGTGYGAALLAACGCVVTALEEDDALLAIARAVLPSVAPAVRLVEGKLAVGVPQGAPWDVIMIEGAVTEIPAALAGQLAPGGRLVTVLATGGAGRAVLAEPVGAPDTPRLKLREVFDCNTPMLPSLRPAAKFVF
jgi:protein-L-isoaspartate(D-aspartate) O-methyltransferase